MIAGLGGTTNSPWILTVIGTAHANHCRASMDAHYDPYFARPPKVWYAVFTARSSFPVMNRPLLMETFTRQAKTRNTMTCIRIITKVENERVLL